MYRVKGLKLYRQGIPVKTKVMHSLNGEVMGWRFLWASPDLDNIYKNFS